jgi:hypothetical protein
MAGKVSHQIADDTATLTEAPGQLIADGRPHRRHMIVPPGPTGDPFGIGDMAVSQAGREQHTPELISTEEHHHATAWPGSIDARAKQQWPELARRRDAIEQAPAARGLRFAAGGVRTGHQHQAKADR